MNAYGKILEYMKEHGGIASSREISMLGIDRKYLSLMTREGRVERPSRGVYTLPGILEDEYYAIQVRCRKGVYSHDTALFLHDLTDRTPLGFSMTLPKGYSPSSMKDEALDFFYVKPDLLGLGKISMKSPHGKPIFAYDMERTICDLVRSKKRIDMQVFTDAIKRYARRKDKDPGRLMKYAAAFGIEDKVREYMEVLI